MFGRSRSARRRSGRKKSAGKTAAPTGTCTGAGPGAAVVLADYDAELRYLSLTVFRPAAEARTSGHTSSTRFNTPLKTVAGTLSRGSAW